MAADPVTKNTVDDLFNYDVDSDDPFGEKTTAYIRDDKPTLSPRAAKRRAGADDVDGFGLDLGLDQEVKIKKRKPNPKLDEALLLSKPGIPKLRAAAKDGISKKLRLKGKGHEFSDAAKLLNYFQLWLDDLYPRAKFADGLQMVEKVGHSKRMQTMRKEWINESKHKELYGDDDMYGGQTNPLADSGPLQNSIIARNGVGQPPTADEDTNSDSLFFPDAMKKPIARNTDEPSEDELEALLAEQPTGVALPNPQQKAMMDDSEGEDDLDALFAEAERRNSLPKAATKVVDENIGSEDEEDLEALLAEQAPRKEVRSTSKLAIEVKEDIGWDASHVEQETRQTAVSVSKSTVLDENDDMDALMADY